MIDSDVDVNSLGILVEPLVEYAVLCETLERIGIVNKKEKKIYPSCYCYKIENMDGSFDYRICHFKELFKLQGKPSTFNKTDQLRLKTITYFLKKWNLVNIPKVLEEGVEVDPINEILKEKIDVVKYQDKSQYSIIHKFKYSN